LTDNKTYAFFVDCYQDGTGGWGLIHTTPTLQEKLLNELQDYAEAISFNRKHFLKLRYDTCKFIINTPNSYGSPLIKDKKKDEL
jgi:hypothetical protein